MIDNIIIIINIIINIIYNIMSLNLLRIIFYNLQLFKKKNKTLFNYVNFVFKNDTKQLNCYIYI
jgi:hypothetical protein